MLKLLFELPHWHGLAKLHMHMDATLDIVSHVTISLANSLCMFEEETCAAFKTQELASRHPHAHLGADSSGTTGQEKGRNFLKVEAKSHLFPFGNPRIF